MNTKSYAAAIPPRTVTREWRIAKACLRREIFAGEQDAAGR